jgi:hypothetical protein
MEELGFKIAESNFEPIFVIELPRETLAVCVRNVFHFLAKELNAERVAARAFAGYFRRLEAGLTRAVNGFRTCFGASMLLLRQRLVNCC